MSKSGKGTPHVGFSHPVGVDGKKDNIKRNPGLEKVPGTGKGGAIYSPFKDAVKNGMAKG